MQGFPFEPEIQAENKHPLSIVLICISLLQILIDPVYCVLYFDATIKATVLQLSIIVALRERGSKPFRTT